MKSSRHQASVDAQLRRVASLGEPMRRRLYRFVVSQPEPVNREQAAAGTEVAHHVAKFHLDKLEEDGLLEAEYRRPPGRTGPGAGRPAKFYRRANDDILVSVPERRYDLAGRLLAEAITAAGTSGVPVSDALHAAADAAGQALGADAEQRLAGRRSGHTATVKAVCEVLEDVGYEPRSGSSGIVLTNCPFHALAEQYTDLVCGMNLDLVSGLLRSLDQRTLRAGLDPAPGRCCVTVRRSRADDVN